MTLHAQEGLRDFQQGVVGRAMRSVTVCTLFGDIGMLVNERALVFHMASGAKGFSRYALDVLVVVRNVRIVAIGAGHLVFGNRMMGELGELHLDLEMAASAELFLLVAADFLL